MAIRSKPYKLAWESQPGSLNDVNRNLADQLSKANEMIEILFKAINDLTKRVTALGG